MVTRELMTIKTISSYHSLNYIYFRDRKIFDFPLSKWCINFYFSWILVLLFISSDTFHLVILFAILCTFPFLIPKCQLRHCWMNFYFRFRSLCIQLCRKRISLSKVSQGFEYASGSKYVRALKIARLWICEAKTGFWICLSKPECALKMLNMLENAWLYLNKQSSNMWEFWMCMVQYITWINYTFKIEHFAKKKIFECGVVKTPEQRHWHCSDVFTANFQCVSHIVLVFLLLTLNM